MRVRQKCGECLGKSDVRLGKVGKSVVTYGKRLVSAGLSPMKERSESDKRAVRER